jgi:MFS family permease
VLLNNFYKEVNMPDAQQEKLGGQSWLMVGTVTFMSIAAAMIWFSVPPMLSGGTLLNTYFPVAKGPEIGHAMEQLGHTMSFISMGALVAAILSSFIAKGIGVKNSIIVGGSLITIAGLGCSFSGANISLLLVMRAVMGFGIGLTAVNGPTAATVWFSAKQRAVALGIWGIWVPVGILLTTNAVVNPLAAGNLATADPHKIWLVDSIIVFVCLLLVIFVYKNPPKGQTEISTEAKPFKEVLPLFKQHQIWMVFISWCAFNYINYSLTTYHAVFFAGGFGEKMFTGTFANRCASIISFLAVISPFFGMIFGRLRRDRKYLMLVVGMFILTMSAVFGLKTEFMGISGWPVFYIYAGAQIFGHAILGAAVRPYVPLLVGRGGVTAVSLGLSLTTIFQYTGQMLTPFFVALIKSNGGVIPRIAGQPIGDLAGWGTATWALTIPGMIAFVCVFFAKPSPHPHSEHGGPHAYGQAAPGDHERHGH